MGTTLAGTAVGAATGAVVGGALGSTVDCVTGNALEASFRKCGTSIGAIQGSVGGTIFGVLATNEIATNTKTHEATTTIASNNDTEI